MKKLDIFLIICLFGIFFGSIFYKNKAIFAYSFNPTVVKNYLRSQDIEDVNNEIKDRVFVSDADIYLATGYLYAKGENPTTYNFQHPPLIKYLFGYSTLLFNNPYIVQVGFGLIFIFLTYFLGLKIFNSRAIPFLASLLLIFDPVFMEQIGQILLDLGQGTFALLYFILSVFYPSYFIFQGITLGLFAASKFWSTALIFILLIWGYKRIVRKEKIDYRKLVYSFVIAFFVFCFTYLRTFIDQGGAFNVFFFEARVLRFMLDHNATALIGGSIALYLSGYFVKWWGNNDFVKTNVWNFLWPITFVVSLFKILFSKKDVKYLISFFPVAYLLLTVTQVPFTRYFIVVLPFFYLSFSAFLVKLLQRYIRISSS